MLKVILEIVIEPRYLDKVCEELLKIKELKLLYEITGEFDLHAEVEVESIDKFRKILNDKIFRIPGIKTTVSSVVLEVKKKE